MPLSVYVKINQEDFLNGLTSTSNIVVKVCQQHVVIVDPAFTHKHASTTLVSVDNNSLFNGFSRSA